jgi:hypothetical protein
MSGMKPKLRKIVFTKQPADMVAGAKSKALRVIVVDKNGNHDPAFDGAISVAMESVKLSASEAKKRPPNSTPKRLRATAPGCEDGVSNVFFVLPK